MIMIIVDSIDVRTGGLHMYAAFSSSIKENQAVQSTHESDIVRSKQKLNLEGMLISSSSNRNISYAFLNHVNDIAFILTVELFYKEILPTDAKLIMACTINLFHFP